MFFMHRLAAVAAITFLVAAPHFAAADESHPAARAALSQKEKLRWNVLMRDGKKFVDDEKWSEASAKFTEAIQLDHHPEPFLWKGFAEEKLGHLIVAKAMYTEALNEAKLSKLPQAVEQAEQALTELGPKIPRLILHLPYGVAATVSIDGAILDMPVAGVEVNPGSRSVDVSAPGREPFHADLKAEEGHVHKLAVSLLPLTPAAVVAPDAPVPPVQGPRGCGACAVGTPGGAPLPIALAALAALVLSERRRSRRQRT
jgi:MYXO-CTERM domain-containing protein